MIRLKYPASAKRDLKTPGENNAAHAVVKLKWAELQYNGKKIQKKGQLLTEDGVLLASWQNWTLGDEWATANKPEALATQLPEHFQGQIYWAAL